MNENTLNKVHQLSPAEESHELAGLVLFIVGAESTSFTFFIFTHLACVQPVVKTIDGASIDLTCGFESEIFCCIEYVWANFFNKKLCRDCFYLLAFYKTNQLTVEGIDTIYS